MVGGATEDNRRERVSRNTSSRPRTQATSGFSIESLVEAYRTIENENFERSRPQRTLMENFLRSSIDLNTRSLQLMEAFTSGRTAMLNDMQERRENLQRVTSSLEDRINSIAERLSNNNQATLPPPANNIPTNTSPTPSTSSRRLNENFSNLSESSRPRQRRRTSI